jgi:hypothetical protein
MQREYRLMKQMLEQGEGQQVDVQMNYIELCFSAKYLIQHHQMAGGLILNSRQPEALTTARH